MVPIIELSKVLLNLIGRQKELLDFLKMHFLGHHMNKVWIFELLKIGVSNIIISSHE